ncbi:MULTISPECIES: hypothetical protein [Pseudomonas]|uniref:hypothetical protein n=1 Tax=Pseudomonas TaxID=286 RepID=UPI00070EFA00|nr:MULTISPECIES: hypothetical protein [Pseudomonas]KQW19787.1 hypothetical protein ASC85_08020 [Pseudomonas sp. Root401]PWD01971.1 hypothetical protein CX658_18610 [Pseudomonas amygdali pv. lachrymans]WHS57368.1 hypothetical protein QLH64_30590 [Pseudomonas brassicacearum]WNZ87551.1 hypothetical protein QOM10_30155 [Pseudomonas sp. P108]
MTGEVKIEADLFEQPSGSVRGTVTAGMNVKGKHKRIAHAYLLVGEAPTITIEVPKSFPLDQLDTLADGLKAFAATVREYG